MTNNVVSVNGKQPNDGSEKRSLLVVEDNPTMRLLLKHVLKTAYEVETASCVDEALRMAQERLFDALVLDIHLGETRTGIDLLQLLRQMPAYREVPAVACTASVGSRASALEAGFDEYVEKANVRDTLTTRCRRGARGGRSCRAYHSTWESSRALFGSPGGVPNKLTTLLAWTFQRWFGSPSNNVLPLLTRLP